MKKNTDLAVAVRDDFQQSGLGEVMMRKIVEIAKEKGIYHFTGIMAAQNLKIKGLLKKIGWKITYIPENGFYRVDIEV